MARDMIACMALTMPTEITSDQLNEVDRMSRRWSFWPAFSYGDGWGYSFLFAGVAGLIAAVAGPERYMDYWPASLGCFAAGGIILAVTYVNRRSRFRQRLAKFNQTAGFATFNSDGIEFRRASTSWVTHPWSSYQRATIGEHTLLLFHAPKGRRYSILPLSTLTQSERSELVAILQLHLGPDKIKEAPVRRSRLPQTT